MAHLTVLKNHRTEAGVLTVLDKELNMPIQRIFYISEVPKDFIRGKHRHYKNRQALVCISGSCDVYVHDSKTKYTYTLDSQDKCLIIEPEDWHEMMNFSEGAVLLVAASHEYDPKDYIYEAYE
jgi:dTDP-4-dehydrorhamnose 3,5-epimerase-like enzyme